LSVISAYSIFQSPRYTGGLPGDTVPTLHAPTKRVFFISLLLVVIAWMSTYIGDHPSALVMLAYIVLALGCFW